VVFPFGRIWLAEGIGRSVDCGGGRGLRGSLDVDGSNYVTREGPRRRERLTAFEQHDFRRVLVDMEEDRDGI
jgi:hypothetical protein